MVEALYLPHNWDLRSALFELKGHYGTVNHANSFNKNTSGCLSATLFFRISSLEQLTIKLTERSKLKLYSKGHKFVVVSADLFSYFSV